MPTDKENNNSQNEIDYSRQEDLQKQELKNTVKFLRQQTKTYKEEIKALKHESAQRAITIESQERVIDKLKFQHQ